MSMPDAATRELMDRLLEEITRPPYNEHLGLNAVSVDSERRSVVIALPYRPEFSHHRSRAVFHGGVIAALIDIAGHAAVAVWHGKPAPTISLNIEYLAGAENADLKATASLRKLGRSISCADIEVTAGNKVVALGRGLFSTRPA